MSVERGAYKLRSQLMEAGLPYRKGGNRVNYPEGQRGEEELGAPLQCCRPSAGAIWMLDAAAVLPAEVALAHLSSVVILKPSDWLSHRVIGPLLA